MFAEEAFENSLSDRRCIMQTLQNRIHLLSRCGAVITKWSRNMRKHQIRIGNILNLEITQIKNYLTDLGGRIVTRNPRTKTIEGKIDQDTYVQLHL